MKQTLVCEIEFINKKAVKEAKSRMIGSETVLKLAEIFKVLGDCTRVKILHAISNKELCVCDLSALLGMTHSAISHQLRLLRNLNLVKFRKDGKIVYYSLADNHVTKLIDLGIKHVQE